MSIISEKLSTLDEVVSKLISDATEQLKKEIKNLKTEIEILTEMKEQLKKENEIYDETFAICLQSQEDYETFIKRCRELEIIE